MSRTSKDDLETEAKDALVHSITSLGHHAVLAGEHAPWHVGATVDGIHIKIQVKAASIVTTETVARMKTPMVPGNVVRIVVGDRITAEARKAIRDEGWGLFDRRGRLMIRADGVLIDVAVPADERRTTNITKTISGAAAISYAVALLLAPESPPALREVARQSGFSNSSIFSANKRLKSDCLIQADKRPLVPELFWALAEQWRPQPIALATLPPVDDLGWIVAGTLGAVAWGAPVVVGMGYPPDFYVASPAHLRRASTNLGVASRFHDRACTVSVAPTPLVFAHRCRPDIAGPDWQFAHGLFAALDLAQDKSRGAEILSDWFPADFTRVW